MMWKPLALALLVERALGQGAFPGNITIPPMLRFQCSQLVVERLDPLVNPGLVGSPHIHQIVGGNSFNASMDPASHDLVKDSTCTSCTFSDDFSNYWTAVLYFKARNGTYKRVPQIPNMGLSGTGGITVYYIAQTTAPSNVTAFKPGFRMLVGDAAATKKQEVRKTCHRCMPKEGENLWLNCASPDSQELPTEPCAGGIRSVITFPTCWDGKNLDSPDHKSHIAYATGADATDVGPTGVCPSSHPVVIPQVMYEVVWDTSAFNDKSIWPEDGSQPFVWSTGDSEGYSQHGDYVFGWKDDSLQKAMDKRCTGDACPGVMNTQKTEEAVKCTVPQTVNQDLDGWLEELPGGVMLH